MNTVIKGTDTCYVCGRILNWESEREAQRGTVVVYQVPEITGSVTACGRNEDGTIKFEILCKCPQCNTKNKFFKDIEI